jgi:hypothetical protein
MPHVTFPNNLPPRLRRWRLLFALNGAQAGSRHLIGSPALPHAAGQKTRRDSDDGKHHHHQQGSGEHLDQL